MQQARVSHHDRKRQKIQTSCDSVACVRHPPLTTEQRRPPPAHLRQLPVALPPRGGHNRGVEARQPHELLRPPCPRQDSRSTERPTPGLQQDIQVWVPCVRLHILDTGTDDEILVLPHLVLYYNYATTSSATTTTMNHFYYYYVRTTTPPGTTTAITTYKNNKDYYYYYFYCYGTAAYYVILSVPSGGAPPPRFIANSTWRSCPRPRRRCTSRPRRR